MRPAIPNEATDRSSPSFRFTGLSRLLKTFVTQISHHNVLPYNLNWMSVDWRPIHHYLEAHPLYVMDVGARGGSLAELDPLKPYLHYYAFDADAEALGDGGSSHGLKSFSIFPYYVGAETGRQEFHLYETPAESSALLPSPSFQREFSPTLRVNRTITVDATTLDELASKGSFEDVDLLKLDTQGTEFDILSRARWVLDRASMVEVEVEFIEWYHGQKLAFDVHRLMHEHGFVMLYLNRVFRGRAAYPGRTRGQLAYGDALFGLDDAHAAALPIDKKARYCVLLIQYGHVDLAHALYRDCAELRDACPGLACYFRPYRGITSLPRRALAMQLDKLIALLLHLRGTNHRRCDSDRSWPIR